MIIFDIGYHRGGFAKEMRKLYGDIGLIGVEANPVLAAEEDCLNYLVSSKGGEPAIFVVAQRPEFSTASGDWISRSRHKEVFQGSKTILVPTITLDDLIKLHGKPDILKVDVEGYEFEVFQGLSQPTGGTILFEFHGEIMDVAERCVRHLELLGYNHWHLHDFTRNADQSYLPNPPFAKNILEQLARCTKDSWGMLYTR